MLKGTYFPNHDENRMKNEGDVEGARAHYLSKRPANLTALLERRYNWMNDYIKPTDTVVEFGSGAGFSREFVKAGKLILTDVVKRDWIDEVADAMDPPFADQSFDAVICSHMIHHVASPTKFFDILARLVKPKGYVLIQEINTSLSMRILLRAMRHEGWSYDVDVFDPAAIANDPRDPWSANCAIPELLFREAAAFERAHPYFKVRRNEVNECLLFPLSGGVISKTKTIQLPRPVLKAIGGLDEVLSKSMPGIFAMGRSVVLQRHDVRS